MNNVIEFTENNREHLAAYAEKVQGDKSKVRIKLYFKQLDLELKCLIEVNGKLQAFDTTIEAIAFLDGIFTILY